jgi:hypothetical protein
LNISPARWRSLFPITISCYVLGFDNPPLPDGGSVSYMQANVNGNLLPLNYPGTCQLTTPTSSGPHWLVCPGADAALASFQGITQVDWQVTLTDGRAFFGKPRS